MTNIDLLRMEMKTLWGKDIYGRFEQQPEVVLLATSNGSKTYMSGKLPSDIARRIRDSPPHLSIGQDPSRPAPGWDRCRELLGGIGAVEQSSGPSYLIEPGIEHSNSAAVVRSDRRWPKLLWDSRPARWWELAEWRDLLQGKLGPWAFMLEDRKVISICHKPRASARAAEAGVWTHPDYRGRGHAAAVTAAWASTPVKEGRRLFYSTSSRNRSSQCVAERLGLKLIGWIWKLRLH